MLYVHIGSAGNWKLNQKNLHLAYKMCLHFQWGIQGPLSGIYTNLNIQFHSESPFPMANTCGIKLSLCHQNYDDFK